MNYNEIEKKLTEACDEAIKRGWKISQRITIKLDTKQCCPYGAAVLVKYNFNLPYYITSLFASDSQYVCGFVAGFDSGELESDSYDNQELGRYLGYKFYQKYILHVNG